MMALHEGKECPKRIRVSPTKRDGAPGHLRGNVSPIKRDAPSDYLGIKGQLYVHVSIHSKLQPMSRTRPPSVCNTCNAHACMYAVTFATVHNQALTTAATPPLKCFCVYIDVLLPCILRCTIDAQTMPTLASLGCSAWTLRATDDTLCVAT